VDDAQVGEVRSVRVLLLIATILAAACPPATAGYGDLYITVYGTIYGDGCTVWEPQGGGVLTVYVVFGLSGCVEEATFRLESGGGFAGVYLGETYPAGGALVGNTHDGIWWVSSGLVAPAVMAAVQYATDGTSPPCSWLEVVGWPEDEIVMRDCSGEAFAAQTFGKLTLNIEPWDEHTCAPQTWCLPVATDQTTWGRVKAMYTN
jgi:hypothetical protein